MKTKIIKYKNGTELHITASGFCLWDTLTKCWLIDASTISKDGIYTIVETKARQDFEEAATEVLATHHRLLRKL